MEDIYFIQTKKIFTPLLLGEWRSAAQIPMFLKDYSILALIRCAIYTH